MRRWGWLGLAAVIWIIGSGVSLAELAAGGQPWGQLLADNFLLARSLPFTLGLGVALGIAKAHLDAGLAGRRADGAIRRFSPMTVALHALVAVAGFVLVLTGGWQYLKGLLGTDSPIPMATVYRIHYLAASLLLVAIAAFVVDWWLRPGERGLVIAQGTWIRSLRGLARELPKPVASTLGYLLGLDLRRAAPPTDQFTFYERIVSFPLWELTLGLITLTGIIKAVRYIYPIPGDVLYWVSTLHVAGGVLLTLKLMDHLRYVLAPARWPLMGAMASGWIAEQYVQLFHPGWYARLGAYQPSAAAPSAAEGTPSQARVAGSAGGGDA